MAESASRKVVIAMDGSQHSNQAFDWYMNHLRQKQDKVTLLHCSDYNQMFQSPTFAMGPLNVETNMKDLLEEQAQKNKQMASDLDDKLKKAEIGGQVKTIHGHPGDSIISAAKEENADLIITGNRGLGTIRRTFLGSVSDYILHHSPIPVLVCRNKKE